MDFTAVNSFGQKGQGLIASKKIPRGTRIVSEAPLLTFPIDETLCNMRAMLEIIKQARRGKRFVLHINGEDIADQTQEQLVVTLMFPAKDESGTGIWATYLSICLIKHSYLPNAEYSWNNTLRRGVTHVVRDVEEGHEITISYGFELFQCRAYHIRGKFGFDCICSFCQRGTWSSNSRDHMFPWRSRNTSKPQR